MFRKRKKDAVPASMIRAVGVCRSYMERGTRIPDHGRLGFPVTTYMPERIRRVPVDVYFYNTVNKRDDKTQFDLDPEIFNAAVEADSPEMFWEAFTKELSECWAELCRLCRYEPDTVEEVDICY